MPGKVTRIDTGESETGGQNEPLPNEVTPVEHPASAPTEEGVGPVIDWDKPQE